MGRIMLLAFSVGMLSATAMAAAPSEIANGAALAQQYCSRCHVVAPSPSRGWTDAPPFETVANRPASNVAGLTSFIEQQHMHMLNLHRPPGEAHALATYIMSLRKP